VVVLVSWPERLKPGEKCKKAYESLYQFFSRFGTAITAGTIGLHVGANMLAGSSAAATTTTSTAVTSTLLGFIPPWALWVGVPAIAAIGVKKTYDYVKYGRHVKIVWNDNLKGKYDKWDYRKMAVFGPGDEIIETIDSLGNVLGQPRGIHAKYTAAGNNYNCILKHHRKQTVI